MLGVRQPDGRTWLANIYDKQHRVIDQTYFNGGHTHYEHSSPDPSGIKVTEVTCPDGSIERYTFNRESRLTNHTRQAPTKPGRDSIGRRFSSLSKPTKLFYAWLEGCRDLEVKGDVQECRNARRSSSRRHAENLPCPEWRALSFQRCEKFRLILGTQFDLIAPFHFHLVSARH
jgi:YD repeat-containing protein